jgi:hypothetical protein
MFRLRIPQIIYASDEFLMKPKDDDDQMMGMKDMSEEKIKLKGVGKVKGGQVIRAQINWDTYLKKFDGVAEDKLTAAISGIVLQSKSGVGENTFSKYIDSASRENRIKTTTIQLMSTPEYQLC